MGHADFVRMNPNVALWRCDCGAFCFEWNIAFGMQLPLHFDAIAGGGNGDILNRSVGSSKHVLIHDIGQRIHTDGNLGEVDGKREGLDIVEHGEALALGGQDQACSWRIWTVTWSVKWYTTLRMSTWTAGVLLPFSCGGLARLERPGVTHATTMRSNAMRVMRSIAYPPLECLFEKSQ